MDYFVELKLYIYCLLRAKNLPCTCISKGNVNAKPFLKERTSGELAWGGGADAHFVEAVLL